jgi:hypothetical protein
MISYTQHMCVVRVDPKLPGDSGEVPISEWSGWQIDPRSATFSYLTK